MRIPYNIDIIHKFYALFESSIINYVRHVLHLMVIVFFQEFEDKLRNIIIGKNNNL